MIYRIECCIIERLIIRNADSKMFGIMNFLSRSVLWQKY